MSEETNKLIKFLPIIIFLVILFCLRVYTKNDNSNQYLDIDLEKMSIPSKIDGYTKCNESNYPLSCDSIQQYWNTYRLESTSPLDKVELLSSQYMLAFKINMYKALHLSKEEFLLQPFVDQIRIIQNRVMLLELHEKEYFETTDEKEIMAEALYVSIGAEPDKNPITSVKFIDDKTAYGVYSVFGNDKSVQFIKEGKDWKINIYKEDPIFDEKRKRLEETMLSSYDSSENYLIDVFGDKKYLQNIKD